MRGDSWRPSYRVGASVAAFALILAACGSSTTSQKNSSNSKPKSSESKSSQKASSSKSSDNASKNSGTLTSCTTDQLAASLAEPSGAAGATYYQLRLKNVSTHACTVYGYPGVSLVQAATGPQIGRSAIRQPATEKTLTLQPGQFAEASFGVEVAQNYSPATCQLTKAGGVLVYPPNQRLALYISTPGMYGCASRSVKLLTVWPLRLPPAG